MATTGKIVEVLFENALETYETQDMLLDKVDFVKPDAGMMQNAGNFVWRSVEQQAPTISGWDLSAATAGTPIEQTYPSVLGTPENDLVEQRADDLRDTQFWMKRGIASGRKQASTLNKNIANAIAQQGSMFLRSNATSGYTFAANCQAIMNERQGKKTDRYLLLNDRDTLTFSSDLAGRQTVQGRPEDTWKSGQIGNNVAEFDVFTGSFLPSLAGGANPATTVTGNQSFAPEGGSVSATGVVTNVDYRTATIPVAASASYNIGDKVTFSNGGTTVKALGVDDKTDSGQAMTFTIVAKPDGTSITVYPKPIALDDGSLSASELAYANVDTLILNLATVDRVNIDASNKTNLFWDKDAIEVIGGTIPANLFKEFNGMKVLSSTMKNGQEMYMVYDGNIATMNFRYRLFTWYGITVRDPSRAGVAVTF
jgi:hypothetical protein